MANPTVTLAARSALALTLTLATTLLSLAACGDGGGDDGPSTPSAVTVHYHRAARDYAGWTVAPSAGSAEASVAQSGSDPFGATFSVPLSPGATALAFTLRNGAEADAAGALTVDVSGAVREVWVFSGYDKAIPREPPALPSNENEVVLYYVRPDGNYTGWGLHLWGDQVSDTAWTVPLQPEGSDPDLGLGFVIPLAPGGGAGNCPAGRICFIVHQGETKDPGPDITAWDRAVQGDVVFLTSGIEAITTFPRTPGAVTISGAGAHLVRRDVLAWNVTDPAAVSFELRYSETAAVEAAGSDVTGGEVIALTPRATALTADEWALEPRVKSFRAFDVAAGDVARIEQALRGQLVAVARDAAGAPVEATQVQTGPALDDLYAYAGPLGLTFAGGVPSFALWAPTAQAVTLQILEADDTPVASVPLARGASGVWAHTGDAAWKGKLYRYAVRVYHPLTQAIEDLVTTDPYAVSLATNGRAAHVVDLDDPALVPPGWAGLAKPPLAAPEDVVVYELHVRDFSASDANVPIALRGKFLALTEDADTGATQSAGRAHLARLAAAGLTHLHLLPVFDLATVDEDAAARVDLDDPFADLCAANAATPTALCGAHAGETIREAMASYAGDSDQQQLVASLMATVDSFNWGYDPLHYGAPEGSYATSAEGPEKILEFRRMVQGIAGLGLRTVMDVVYNHTNASGVGDKAVLDKLVPGYYHRRNVETGFVTTSSCCANTATERRMMERLMIDTLVRWARDYKVDGFRFDLMGLHTKANMIAVRDALLAVDPDVYLYGEGWTMGDAAGGLAATQVFMNGTGIGTFNDRLRDGARGGGPFDDAAMPLQALRANQGFATGMVTAPNERGGAWTAADLAPLTDWIKVGMAGNLRAFELAKTADGAVSTGFGVAYKGAPAGYTDDPSEVINYVSKHDNQTIFDLAQYKLATGTPMADRVRANTVALSLVMLGQGVPFFHAGDDLLRSKSMERDSYDSGDWFNRVDWTGAGNNWKVGLPNAGKDAGNWTTIRAIFGDASIAPTPAHVGAAAAAFRELLRLRASSPLFRLRTRDQVLARVDFHNFGAAHVPGVIAMTVADGTCAGADLDPARDGLVVIVNADDEARAITVPGGAGATLHAVQADATDEDPVVKTATVVGEVFTVPARTTAVFEQLQAGAQGGGVACNTR